MSDPLAQWRAAYPEAAAALDALSLPDMPVTGGEGSEARAQSLVRLEAPRHGYKMWRNNRGAWADRDDAGNVRSVIRYGLANDTDAMDKILKSHDLIGWRRVTVTPEMVGQMLAVFTSWEIKPPGWRYTGAGREGAQMAWANLVAAAGGEARFLTGPGEVGVVP